MTQPDHSLISSFSTPVEFKFASATGAIEGYGAVFGNVDLGGDVIAAGAFAESINEMKAARRSPALLWSHDPARPIGVWDQFAEDSKGIHLSGRLNLDTNDGREAHALAAQGAFSGLSIGWRAAPNGTAKDQKSGVRTITKAKLFEVSLVAVPMNPEARVTAVKSITTIRDFETFLHANGFAKVAARRLAQGGWAGLSKSYDSQAGALIAAIRAATQNLKGT